MTQIQEHWNKSSGRVTGSKVTGVQGLMGTDVTGIMERHLGQRDIEAWTNESRPRSKSTGLIVVLKRGKTKL